MGFQKKIWELPGGRGASYEHKTIKQKNTVSMSHIFKSSYFLHKHTQWSKHSFIYCKIHFICV